MDRVNPIYCGEVKVITGIPIECIVNMDISVRENEHARLWIKAVLQEGFDEKLECGVYVGEHIRVTDEKDDELVFYGEIAEIDSSKEFGNHVAEIWGYSVSRQLDREKKECSYQDTSATYEQIVKAVLGENMDAAIIWNVERGRKICNPMIQYEETDWEFLKRLASHFHAALYVVSTNERLGICFEMPRGKERDIKDLEILRYGFSSSYHMDGAFEEGMPKSRARFLECRSTKRFCIGDYVNYRERIYKVFRINAVFAGDEWVYLYTLGTEAMYYKKKVFNCAILGTFLCGTIGKTKEEDVYIQLDINKREQNLYGWPFVPGTGNLCYCMPEKGTRAMLYFPTDNEKDGVIVHLLEKGDRNRNSQNREFATAHNKKIEMYPELMEIGGDTCRMTLNDELGIKIVSAGNISMSARKDIVIMGSKINMSAPIEVVCRARNSNIDLCRDLNFYAPAGVSTQGTSDGKKGMVSEQGEEKFGLWKAAFSVMAAIPVLDIGKGDQDSIADLAACGSIARYAHGSTVIAMKEVMEGMKEEETSFPEAFKSMQAYTVKGGFSLPDSEDEI